MVRGCEKHVSMVVCQPEPVGAFGRKSTMQRAKQQSTDDQRTGDEAAADTKRKAPHARVRFAESVCVNGAPLFPPSAFSLGDICVPPMANVLKVFLENGQTKSFKYDASTTVEDVVSSLKDKLCLTASEHFSLVLEHVKTLRRNKLTLLDPEESLARIAARPGSHKLRCLFRVAFVPVTAAALAQRDLNALDYLYMQCCNDVAQERFAPELQPDVALRLAALHMHQHALANNLSTVKLTVKTVEREFGLERFVPSGLLENMKRKELRRLIGHFLKLNQHMTGSTGKQLTALQTKLHYLDIISTLPSYGAKCFSFDQKGDVVSAPEKVILVSPRFGFSQISSARNSVPTLISNLEDILHVSLTREDQLRFNVEVGLTGDRQAAFLMDDVEAKELALVLAGYHRLVTGRELYVEQEKDPVNDDLAPPYLAQHCVVPDLWSYLPDSVDFNSVQSMVFNMQPPYHNTMPHYCTNAIAQTQCKKSSTECDRNMNTTLSNNNHAPRAASESFDESIAYTSSEGHESPRLVEARNEEILRRVAEMQKLVENSEQYLNEHGESTRAEWQETSVDCEAESDTESSNSRMSSMDDSPGKLKHSDSLLLLTETLNQDLPIRAPNGRDCMMTNGYTFADVPSQSESDTDSLYTPNGSPMHRTQYTKISQKPPITNASDPGLKEYLRRLRQGTDRNRFSDSTDCDLIDLTSIPPPQTPDEPDCPEVASVEPRLPPTSFADPDPNAMLGLEEFLATVAIEPPAQKATPAVELTPEEILSYIIPPPPTSTVSSSITQSDSHYTNRSEVLREMSSQNDSESNGGNLSDTRNSLMMRSLENNRVIEYSTIDRKGTFSCCAKDKTDRSKQKPMVNGGEPKIMPRSNSAEFNKPPERPPKTLDQRMYCNGHVGNTEATKNTQVIAKVAPMSSSTSNEERPPSLPPRNGDATPPPLPHSYVLPKKPPLPPAPILAKTPASPSSQQRVASIGSPHLQRGRIFDQANSHSLPRHCRSHSETTIGARTLSEHRAPCSPQLNRRNNSVGTNQAAACQLLGKTDAAMAGLLVRLDQVAAQCTAAQAKGGGDSIDEEKFQTAREELTAQALRLVTSSKLLVISMSDSSLAGLPEHLAASLTALRSITELTQSLCVHTSSPLQTRNIVLKVHDVASGFRELAAVKVGPMSSSSINGDPDRGGQLALRAECLADVLAALLRSLRVFSP